MRRAARRGSNASYPSEEEDAENDCMKPVRGCIGIGICVLVSLLSSYSISAAEDAESIWKALGFKFAGAVDVSYSHNFNNPNTNLNQLRIFDSQANSFVPNVMVIGMERLATAGSALDRDRKSVV